MAVEPHSGSLEDLLNPSMLAPSEVPHFIQQGFVRIDRAFPREVADAAREVLWRDTGCDPRAPETWTRPVVRLGMYSQLPFREAANSPVLHGAFDQLLGSRRWLPCGAVGTFPVRFPAPENPGDTGWHVDASFGWDHPDFMEWRVNLRSRGRGLLMLMLFSDVGEDDAPTRLRAGSHLEIARRLAPAGEAGLSLRELAANGFEESARCPEHVATGAAGTVYLCHPFLVHAGQPHRGTRPRFMAQPPLLLRSPEGLDLDAAEPSPVEVAIRTALG